MKAQNLNSRVGEVPVVGVEGGKQTPRIGFKPMSCLGIVAAGVITIILAVAVLESHGISHGGHASIAVQTLKQLSVYHLSMTYSDAELIEAIRAVADEVGEKPTLNEFREHGSVSASTIYRHFGSWQDALESAGYEPREPDSAVTNEELLSELDRLADELDDRPTATDMNDRGAYWASTYRRAFGSWNNALEAAGIDSSPSQDRQPVSDEALLEELQRVGDLVDGTPNARAMEEHGEHSPNTYVRRFGSWNDAVTKAGFEPNTEVGTETVSTEALIDDLHRIAEEIGERPIVDDLREHGEHALRTYQERFGSWSAALAAAFDDESDSTEKA